MRPLAALALAGCWHAAPSPPAPPAAPATAAEPVAGFAACDAIVVDDNGFTLTTLALAHDAIRPLGTRRFGAALPPPPQDFGERMAMDMPRYFVGGWGDRTHFFVRTTARHVELLTATGSAPVRLPPRAHGEPDAPRWEADWTWPDLVADQDGAWWSRCTEEGPEDGGRCATWTSTHLWPPDDARVDQEKLPGEYPLPEVDAPAGYKFGGDTCTDPSGVSHALVDTSDPDGREHVGRALFVSADPPRLLVEKLVIGEFRTRRTGFELHAGCGATLATGTTAIGGPDGLWALDGALYRGGKALGNLPPGTVHFRPR